MRSPIVVEVYDPRQQLPCGHHVRGAFHPVEPFLLDDAVDPLGDRVVGRLVVLRPADRGFMACRRSIYDYNNLEQPPDRSGGSVHFEPQG